MTGVYFRFAKTNQTMATQFESCKLIQNYSVSLQNKIFNLVRSHFKENVNLEIAWN